MRSQRSRGREQQEVKEREHPENNLEESSASYMLSNPEPKGKKRKTKKEDAAIKTKNKKIKKESVEGKQQMSINEWLSKTRKDKERKRHVQFFAVCNSEAHYL